MIETMYVIPMKREVIRSDEDCCVLFKKDMYKDLREAFYKHISKMDVKKLSEYAKHEVDYLLGHSLKEWYDNHIFIFPESSEFYVDYMNDEGRLEIESLSMDVKEIIKNSGLSYRKYIVREW